MTIFFQFSVLLQTNKKYTYNLILMERNCDTFVNLI